MYKLLSQPSPQCILEALFFSALPEKCERYLEEALQCLCQPFRLERVVAAFKVFLCDSQNWKRPSSLIRLNPVPLAGTPDQLQPHQKVTLSNDQLAVLNHSISTVWSKRELGVTTVFYESPDSQRRHAVDEWHLDGNETQRREGRSDKKSYTLTLCDTALDGGTKYLDLPVLKTDKLTEFVQCHVSLASTKNIIMAIDTFLVRHTYDILNHPDNRVQLDHCCQQTKPGYLYEDLPILRYHQSPSGVPRSHYVLVEKHL